MPEDLVLNGSFEAIFDTKQVHFNPSTGSFLIEYNTDNTLYFEGKGVTLFWTMRALARLGFKMIQDERASKRLLLSEKDPRWVFVDDGKLKEFNKLSELVFFLKSFTD